MNNGYFVHFVSFILVHFLSYQPYESHVGQYAMEKKKQQAKQ